MARLGERLKLDPYETAAGINRIVDYNMADLIRRETIEKGLDPRDFVVFTYGGAGASHAGMYAREIGVSQIVVPLMNVASVWSALGVASSDVIHIHQQNLVMRAPFEVAQIGATAGLLRERALAQMADEGFDADRVSLRWTADLRHRLQVHVVEVALHGQIPDDAMLAALPERFRQDYEALYGEATSYAAAGIELVTLRCTASAAMNKPSLRRVAERSPTPEAAGKVPLRPVYWPEFGRQVDTPIYRPEHLAPGNIVAGPAIIEPTVTTIVVRPGQQAKLDGFGNIVITLNP